MVTSSPTGAMPQDFWSKIGAVASAVVNTLVQFGQMIYKGLVALGTFLVNLAQAIADWGMKALGAVWNAAVAVAQTAQRLLDTFVNIVLAGIKQLINAILEPLIQALNNIRAQYTAMMGSVASGLSRFWRGDYRGVLDALSAVAGFVSALSPLIFFLGAPLFAMSLTITILAGPINFAMSLVTNLLSSVLMQALGGLLTASGNAAIQTIGWLLSGDFLSAIDNTAYSILGVSTADLPPDSGNPNMESFFGMLAAGLVGGAVIAFIVGGFNVAKVWRDARFEYNGLHGYLKSDALQRSMAAMSGLAFLVLSTVFALAAAGSGSQFDRIMAGAISIVLGLLSLAAVHVSLPHNLDGGGNLITTVVVPPIVKVITDVLGVLSIAASATSILAAKVS